MSTAILYTEVILAVTLMCGGISIWLFLILTFLLWFVMPYAGSWDNKIKRLWKRNR